MAIRLRFVRPLWLLALAAVAGCGNGHGQPMDMAGGTDLADGSSGPTVGGTVTGLAGSGLVLQNSGGDDLAVAKSGAFTFATPLADGAGYDVSILTQPTSPPQICAVANGKGTIAGGAAVTSVAVRCAPVVRFVLVADKSDKSVASFVLDSGSGRLRYAGKTAAGTAPVSIATDPAGRFAYVVSGADVLQYAIDGNGQLAPLSPAMVVVGAASSIVVDPAGAYAYVAGNGAIAQFGIGADGTLRSLSAPLNGPGNMVAIAVEPAGRFAYAADASDGNVGQFSVGADGRLQPLATATIAAGTAPSGVAVDPSGRFVYVTDGTGAAVAAFTIGSDGALAANGTAPAAAGASSPIVDPMGRFLFVVNAGAKTVSQYSIGSDGKLTPASPATVAAGTGAAAVLVDGSGKLAWVANPGDDTIGEYVVGSGGTLAANAPATLRGQAAPTALALVGGGGFARPVATHAYVSDGNGSVRDFPVGADGVLGTPTSITASGHPQSIVLDAAGTHAYVLDDPPVGSGGNVLQFAVSSTGAWSALTPASVSGVDAPAAIALHPSG
ncbi:MAG TPA: beta-propeller fold lactonase family protein, partial [Polyangia bacterium]